MNAPDIRLMNLVSAALALVVGAVLLTALGSWAVRQPVFSIRSIDVGGEVTRSSVATIRANAAPRLAGNFFTLDLSAARAAFESVPWVREAVVRRVWPNRLAVVLQEHHPAAYWNDADDDRDGDRLVNTQGEVFQANAGDVEDDELPSLRGPEGSAALMLATYRRLEPLLAPAMAIDVLTLSGRGSWRAETVDGATIEIGRGSEDLLAERVARFVRTLPQVSQRFGRPVLYADLRHSDAYAVRLEGIETNPGAPARPPRTRGRDRR